MTAQKTALQLQKAAALKALRTGIRLKYSLLADEEINRLIPALETRIDDAIASGRQLELTVGQLLDEI